MSIKYPSNEAKATIKGQALVCAKTNQTMESIDELNEAEADLEALLLKYGLMKPDQAIDDISYGPVGNIVTGKVCHAVYIVFDDGEQLAIYCNQE